MEARQGKVVAFDREVGLGEVRGDDGTALPFHCIEIADGSRDIAVGTRVTYRVVPKLGSYEASGLTPD